MPTFDLIGTTELARRLNVDKRTVHRMVADGRIRAEVKAPGLRGALLFSPDQVSVARLWIDRPREPRRAEPGSVTS